MSTFSLEDVFPELLPVSKAPSLSELEERAGILAIPYGAELLEDEEPKESARAANKAFAKLLRDEKQKYYKAVKEGVVFWVRNPALWTLQSRKWLHDGKHGTATIERETPIRKGQIKDLVGGSSGSGRRRSRASIDEVAYEAA